MVVALRARIVTVMASPPFECAGSTLVGVGAFRDGLLWRVVHGGAAGDVAPPMPQQAGGQGAVGLPGLGEHAEDGWFGAGVQAFDVGGGGLQSEVAGGEHVQTAEGEEEVDFGGPDAEAADRRDRIDGLLVRQGGQDVRGECAFLEGGGDRAGVADFGAGEAGGAQGAFIEEEEFGGGEATGEGAAAAPDGGGGLVADLLADDGVEQAGEAGLADTPGKGAGFRLDAGEVGVGVR